MQQKTPPDPGLRMLLWSAVVLVVWGASYGGAVTILKHHPASPWVRGGAVALGTCGFMTWLGLTAKAIRAENEFTRQIHLVALSVAFAVSAVFIFVADMLHRAAFVNYVSLM